MLQVLAALALVLGLMWALVWALKKMRIGGVPVLGDAGRLQITAQLPLDMKHRVVVVRCDGTEHMIILGGADPVLLSSKDAANAA